MSDNHRADDVDPASGAQPGQTGWVHCIQWYHATAAQADRLLNSGQVVEGYLFVSALRNLRRAAELVLALATEQAARDATKEAIALFDAQLPDAKDARDVLEHFDDYAQGRGRLQVRDGDPYDITVSHRSAADGGQQMVLHVGPLTVPVADAAAAACRLYADLYAALHPDPAVSRDWSRHVLCEGTRQGVYPVRTS